MFFSPVEALVTRELMERFGDPREVLDKAPVKIEKTDKRLDLFLGRWFLPVHDRTGLFQIGSNLAVPNDESKVSDLVHLKEALGWLEVEFVFPKTLQDPVDLLSMIFNVVRKDENVIQIDDDMSLID